MTPEQQAERLERAVENDQAPKPMRRVIENMHTLRRARNWSAREFAERLAHAGAVNITRHALANIDSGRRTTITVDELFAFAHVLGVPIQRLTEGPGCHACEDSPPAGFACLTCGRGAE